MNLYLIIFTAGTYKVEQVYEKHKDLFVELEKHFTLHLVNYTDSESIPSHEYKMAFIASGGVENAVVRFFSILPYPITLLTDGLNNSLAAALEISAWIQSRDMKVKIIHGSVPIMVNQVLLHHQAFAAKRSLKKETHRCNRHSGFLAGSQSCGLPVSRAALGSDLHGHLH